MSVFAPALSMIWQTIESYQLDPAALFANEGIQVSIPIDPHLRIPGEALDRVRARAIEQTGDEAFGLMVADHLHPSHFGALGYAWLASSSLRKALERMSLYIHLFNEDSEVTVEEEPDYLVVTDRVYSQTRNPAARDDTSLAILVQMCRFICGADFKPGKVTVRHPEPEDTEPWTSFFGCAVEFSRPENRFWVCRKTADKVLTSANAQLALINDQLIAGEIARLESRDIVARVRAAISEQLPSMNTSEQSVAKALQMTSRTMHRKLAQHDTNFSCQLSTVRCELARHYLGDQSLPLTEIAFLLGFSQTSSLSRAFRKWTGMSPSQFRQKAEINQAEPSS